MKGERLSETCVQCTRTRRREDLTGKCLLAASDNDRSNVLVFVILGEGIVQFLKQRARESIEGLGTVKSDCDKSAWLFHRIICVTIGLQ